jgi:hypothetical protein
MKLKYSGHSPTAKTDDQVGRMKALAFKNRRVTIHKAATMLGTSFGSVQSILKDNLNKCQIATTCEPIA